MRVRVRVYVLVCVLMLGILLLVCTTAGTDPGTVPPYDPLASAEDGDAPDGTGAAVFYFILCVWCVCVVCV